MAKESTIRIYRSETPASTPSLTAGELGVNLTDRKLFVGGTAGSNLEFVDSSQLVTSVNGATGAITNVAKTNTAQTFTATQSFSAGLTALGATFSTAIAAPGIKALPASAGGSNIVLNSINEYEVVAGVLYTGGEITAQAQNKIDFTVGSGNNTVPYPQMNFTNTNGNSSADISFTAIGGDINFSAGTNINIEAWGLIFNPVNYINMADGVLYVDDTNNRVGVNTTSPQFPLDVSGQANFSGGITAPNATLTTIFTTNVAMGTVSYEGPVYAMYNAGGTDLVIQSSTDPVKIGDPDAEQNGAYLVVDDTNQRVEVINADFHASVVNADSYRITSNAINAQTGTTYSLLSSDNGKIVTLNNGSSITLTVPSGLPVGFNCTVIQLGAGAVGITSSGTTLNSFEGKLNMAGQHAAVSIVSYSSNVFNVAGGLTG